MQEDQQQQQQQQDDVIHFGVSEGIEESKQGHHPELVVINCWNGGGEPVNLPSVRYLVDFLQGDEGGQHVTKLRLGGVHLSSPSDGGLDVLCHLFAISTRLTELDLVDCDFGGPAAGRQVLESLRSSSSVTDLAIHNPFCNLEGAAFGGCLSPLFESNPTLVRLILRGPFFGVEGVRELLPGIQTLTEFHLHRCRIGDEGLGLIAASLVGNTTMKVFDISDNNFTPTGIVHIFSLVQSTRLAVINLRFSGLLWRQYNRTAESAHLNAQNLQRLRDDLYQNPHLLRLGLEEDAEHEFPEHVAEIETLLEQNRDWPSVRQTSANQAKTFEASQDDTHETLSDNSIWFKAIVRLAARRCNSGASGIFHIFKTRPKLLCQERSPIATNQEGKQFLSDMVACQKMEPRINRLGQSSWRDEVRADLCRYFSSAGTDREAFVRAVDRLTEYEQRMEENAAVEQQADHQHTEEQPQQDPSQPAAATHQQPEDVMDMNNHDGSSSSSNNRKRQRLS